MGAPNGSPGQFRREFMGISRRRVDRGGKRGSTPRLALAPPRPRPPPPVRRGISRSEVRFFCRVCCNPCSVPERPVYVISGRPQSISSSFASERGEFWQRKREGFCSFWLFVSPLTLNFVSLIIRIVFRRLELCVFSQSKMGRANIAR